MVNALLSFPHTPVTQFCEIGWGTVEVPEVESKLTHSFGQFFCETLMRFGRGFCETLARLLSRVLRDFGEALVETLARVAARVSRDFSETLARV